MTAVLTFLSGSAVIALALFTGLVVGYQHGLRAGRLLATREHVVHLDEISRRADARATERVSRR